MNNFSSFIIICWQEIFIMNYEESNLKTIDRKFSNILRVVRFAS